MHLASRKIVIPQDQPVIALRANPLLMNQRFRGYVARAHSDPLRGQQ
jgi:hypothetical protein